MHVERVREMIAYFGMLDRAGAEEDGEGGEEGGRGPMEGAGRARHSAGRAARDEPEEAAAKAAASYARVQEEGGAYVRAPQMSP